MVTSSVIIARQPAFYSRSVRNPFRIHTYRTVSQEYKNTPLINPLESHRLQTPTHNPFVFTSFQKTGGRGWGPLAFAIPKLFCEAASPRRLSAPPLSLCAHDLPRKSFACHSYRKHRGWGMTASFQKRSVCSPQGPQSSSVGCWEGIPLFVSEGLQRICRGSAPRWQ
jgi:hypothetical protein